MARGMEQTGNISREECYEVVKNVLSKYPKLDESKKIKREIENRIKPYPYSRCIVSYLFLAIENGDNDVNDAFYNIFYEDIKEHNAHTFCAVVMSLEGLYDIPSFDYLRGAIKWQRSPDSLVKPSLREKIIETSTERVDEIYQHSQYDFPLLIVGETGTSKELVARVLHNLSKRRKEIFMEINCAAIPKEILESELFGHTKDAYTGAKRFEKGLLAKSDNGTVFLDEIGKMPKALQVKLLKVIEEKQFKRLGESRNTSIDVRFISAIQPKDMGNIVEDLKYRLGYPDVLKLSTLHERLNESPFSSCQVVLEGSLMTISKKMKTNKMSINFDCYNIFRNYEYNGNYRELESILRAAIRSAKKYGRKEILPEDLYLLEERLLKNKTIIESEDKYTDIKLKDIISYADQVKASIIESKLKEIIKSGKEIKTVLQQEGLSESKYQMFVRNIKSITGKGIREIKKNQPFNFGIS